MNMLLTYVTWQAEKLERLQEFYHIPQTQKRHLIYV